jgi:hypothetical protein
MCSVLKSGFSLAFWLQIRSIKEEVQLPPFRVFDALPIDVGRVLDMVLKCKAYVVREWVDRSNCSTSSSRHIDSLVLGVES